MPFSIDESAGEVFAIAEVLATDAVQSAVHEVALDAAEVGLQQDAVAVGHAPSPLALEDAPVGHAVCPEALGQVFLEEAWVSKSTHKVAAVGPPDASQSMLLFGLVFFTVVENVTLVYQKLARESLL